MEEKQKPKEILELEKVYGITLRKSNGRILQKNNFKLDKDGNVVEIDLLGNKIEEIKGFDNFKYLQVLILSVNNISKIENLDKLQNLKKLFLDINKIKKIENLSNLKNLQSLSLSINQIEDIEEVKNLLDKKLFPKLKHLIINNNPFEKELRNIKLDIWDSLEILRNYFKLEDAKNKIEIKNIPKIMLLGNHNSGKSTFLNYFLNDIFNEKQESTHILNIQKYEKENSTKAIFYDFGGQDYYHGIYKAFMTNEALNLIFWKEVSNNNNLGEDSTGGFTQNFNCEYWIKQVKHFGDRNKSWLIQTFLDENRRKALTNDELQEVIDDEYHITLKSPIKPNLKALKENLDLFIEKSSNISISKNYYEFINSHITNVTSHEYVDIEELEKEVIRTIFDDICAFYVNNENHRSKLLPEIEETEKDKFKHLIPIKYPDELYISLDNKYFVNFNILDDETKTKESILAYEIEDFKINKTNAKSLFTRNFAYLSTNNKGLNKMKKIFVSYSRKDADYRDVLRQHLNMLTIFDIADNWACEDITIGKWDEQIQKELLDSDIVIYMLSANFFSSSYIREKEVLEVIKQMKENPNKKILPIIVSEFVGLDNLKRLIQNPTNVQTAMLDISNHQFLPYGNVWNHLTNQNEEKIISLEEHRKNQSLNSALKQICDEILKVI